MMPVCYTLKFLPRTGAPLAEVAELADALASGASGRKAIGVRVPASALLDFDQLYWRL